MLRNLRERFAMFLLGQALHRDPVDSALKREPITRIQKPKTQESLRAFKSGNIRLRALNGANAHCLAISSNINNDSRLFEVMSELHCLLGVHDDIDDAVKHFDDKIKCMGLRGGSEVVDPEDPIMLFLHRPLEVMGGEIISNVDKNRDQMQEDLVRVRKGARSIVQNIIRQRMTRLKNGINYANQTEAEMAEIVNLAIVISNVFKVLDDPSVKV